MRAVLTTFVAVAAVAAQAAPAMASTVSTHGEQLQITGSKANDEVLIHQKGDDLLIAARGSGHLRESSSKCRPAEGDDRVVECTARGIDRITANLYGGNDWIVAGSAFPDSRGDRGRCSSKYVSATLVAKSGAGNDVVEAGSGNDVVRGGPGRDLLMACKGDDLVSGGPGPDRVSGDAGDDRLRGRDGDDWLVGCMYDPDDVNYPSEEKGDDILQAGTGDDFLFGCKGTDAFTAGAGEDALNTRDGVAEIADCGADGGDVIYRDEADSPAGCEAITDCTTDNFPIGRDTGDPSCFARVSAGRK